MAKSDNNEGKAERVNQLRAELEKSLGKKKAQEIIRLLQQTTMTKLGADASLRVAKFADIEDILVKLWDQGLFGLGREELLKVDDYLNDVRLKHQAMLRFMRHYLEPSEYHALLAAFELVKLLRDKHPKVLDRHSMIDGLYRRINKLRYGRRVLTMVSIGKFENVVYPQMRDLESRISTAGRVNGPELEAIKQIFYSYLKTDRTKYFVRRESDVAEVFDRIADRFFNEEEEPIPYLDIYSAKTARKNAHEAIKTFLKTYPQFESIEYKQKGNPEASYIRIR